MKPSDAHKKQQAKGNDVHIARGEGVSSTDVKVKVFEKKSLTKCGGAKCYVA